MDDLLKKKDPIPDDGFSARVMANVPRRTPWLRVLEVLLPTATVGLLAPSLPMSAAVALALGIAAYAVAEG